MAMFLPPWQAIKMPISGKIVDTGRFSGFALRFGGSSAVEAEVLLPLDGLRQVRCHLEGAKSLTGNPVWIGPHQAVQVQTTWEGEASSQSCEIPPNHTLPAPKMQTRRQQAFQRSLSPELPVPRHHEARDLVPKLRPASDQRTFRSSIRVRPRNVSRPATVPACVESKHVHDTSIDSIPSTKAVAKESVKSPQLPSLTVIDHGTSWRKLGRKLDVLADPVLLELAEQASKQASRAGSFLALIGECFHGRVGQRFADAIRALGYKVIYGNAALLSWASAREDSNDRAELVLVVHWKSLKGCIGVLQSHVLRGVVVLCDHCDEAFAKAEAKSLPCPWQVMQSLIFN